MVIIVPTTTLIKTVFVNIQNLPAVPVTLPLKNTRFYDAKAEGDMITCASVGVVCFSIEPKSQKLFLLLGKETKFEDLTSSKGVWCAFSGGPEHAETPEQTAAREFAEESLCCINVQHAAVRQAKVRKCTQKLLENRQFFLRVQVRMPSLYIHSQREVCRIYFVKQVPWQSNAQQRFAHTRRQFIKLLKTPYVGNCPFALRRHPAITVNCNQVFINQHYLEKKAIKWWSIDKLRSAVHRRGRYQNQRFRKSFLPVLKIILNELTNRKQK